MRPNGDANSSSLPSVDPVCGQSQSRDGTMVATQKLTIEVNPNQDSASPSVTFIKLVC